LHSEQTNPVPRWRDRLAALRNTLPIFRMVWEASPAIVRANIVVRLIVSLLPLAMLAVTQVIIDSIYNLTAKHVALPSYFWWLVGLEFALACVSTILVRITDYCDTVLADKYAKYVSVRIMEHASRLDLTTYEDPAFQDKLERARVQGTDRVLMIQAAGRLIQQVITTASLKATSRWPSTSSAKARSSPRRARRTSSRSSSGRPSTAPFYTARYVAVPRTRGACEVE